MPEDKLIYLRKCIRAARKDCCLTQQELADQCGLAVKTIQEIEKGRKNATYETLAQLIERLGITANTLFPSKTTTDNVEIQQFIGKFQSCNPEDQKILINTLNFLTEQLLNRKPECKLPSSD